MNESKGEFAIASFRLKQSERAALIEFAQRDQRTLSFVLRQLTYEGMQRRGIMPEVITREA